MFRSFTAIRSIRLGGARPKVVREERDMTDAEAKAFDAAFDQMDRAFVEMDKAFAAMFQADALGKR